MLLYTWQETAWLVIAAVVLDLLIGDPRRLPHPVVWIGTAIARLEQHWRRPEDTARTSKRKGLQLMLTITLGSALATLIVGLVCTAIHPWLGYAYQVWFISTTIAVKGLRDAAVQVLEPLQAGRMQEARKYLGYIVGRDTEELGESEIVRGTVETVAENTVDAAISPIVYALLGAAPLAMLYRATNTLDSMVGYKNEKYVHFGWASARWDDVLNYIPARLCGALMCLTAFGVRGASPRLAWRSMRIFARLHPSPNSGIPESAVAGALGIELGGTNRYGGRTSERARMGWPLGPLAAVHIMKSVRFLYGSVGWCLTAILICLALTYIT